MDEITYDGEPDPEPPDTVDELSYDEALELFEPPDTVDDELSNDEALELLERYTTAVTVALAELWATVNRVQNCSGLQVADVTYALVERAEAAIFVATDALLGLHHREEPLDRKSVV